MQKYKPEGNISGSYAWKHDEDGNIIEQLSYDSGGNLNTKQTYNSVFELDKNNNWIKEIRSYMVGIKRVFYREIIYCN